MTAAKQVRVVSYDERWPAVFGQERVRLAQVLAEAASAIHHMGSTSVPGLCAKPVIDILVETPDLVMIDGLTSALEARGYTAKGEYGICGRRYFSRPEGATPKVHVHVYAQGHPEIGRHLRFRDHLRSHSASAARYGALKRRLALAHGDDPHAYQSGKAAFIDHLDAQAAMRT